MEKKLQAEIMREATASADYRKCLSLMRKLTRTFSKVRFVEIHNPDEQTIEMLKNQGVEVEQTKIKEYKNFKVSW